MYDLRFTIFSFHGMMVLKEFWKFEVGDSTACPEDLPSLTAKARSAFQNWLKLVEFLKKPFFAFLVKSNSPLILSVKKSFRVLLITLFPAKFPV